MDLLDAQPEFTKSFWDYLDILVNEDAHQERARDSRPAPRDLRRGREGLRRRPPLHRRDLGRRIQLRHADRRPLGHPFDGDARLRRAPPGLFPRGVALGAGNPRARRRAGGSSQGIVGRRLRPDPVHADLVQALRRRLRRRRPPRRRRFRPRSHRLDREQSQEGRLGRPARPGATRSWCRTGFNFLLADRSRVMSLARMGARRHPPRRRQGVPARRGHAPICWCPRARRGRAS